MFACVVCAACLLVACSPPPQAARTTARGKPPSVAVIPFELRGGHMITTVMLGDGLPLRVALDSGMGEGLLLLKPTASIAAHGDIRFENSRIVLRNVPLVSVDPKGALARRSQAYSGVEALLGGSLFAKFVVRIDFGSGHLVLYDPASFREHLRHASGRIVIGAGVPYMRAYLLDRSSGTADPINVILDTGSGGDILVLGPAGCGQWGGGGLATRFSLGGRSYEGRIVRSGSLLFAGERVDDVLITCGMSTRSTSTIGNGILRRFTVVFDYQRGLIVLEPSSRRNQRTEVDMVGLDYRRSPEGHIVVARVKEGYPASEAGVKVGDHLVAIDGEPAEHLTAGDVQDIQTSNPGSTRTYRLSRGSEEFEVKIVLKPML
jgi:hypothetical protein